MTDPTLTVTYFVTDIESDGPDPALNSMISFATVAVSEAGVIAGEFSANLKPRSDRTTNARTMRWWDTQPEAYAAATRDPQDPREVMAGFADWVESFGGRRIFAARPLLFDGSWVDEYLRTYAATRIFSGPFDGRQIFTGLGLDIESYLQGLFGWPHVLANDCNFPADWLGGFTHTHRAIDDAMGYACVLSRALRLAAKQPQKTDDFLR